jgi:alkylated DNA repair dioxygenase AlkB
LHVLGDVSAASDGKRYEHGFQPDQCTVNKYNAGHGIPPHIDTHSAFTHLIVSLSLGATTVMDFRRQSAAGQSYAATRDTSSPSPSPPLPSTSTSTLPIPSPSSSSSSSSSNGGSVIKSVTPRKQATSKWHCVPLPRRSLIVLAGNSLLSYHTSLYSNVMLYMTWYGMNR